LAVIDEARGQSGRTRLAYVNRAINLAVRAKNDVANYGVAELWTTPLATLANGAGDCTDYAIAKYYALDDLGIPADDRRLVIVLDRSLTPYTPSMYHTILAVRDERRWLILDNRTMTVVDAADHPNYVPLLEFDDRGVQRLERSDKLASGGCSPNSG
jgi:predicted transglutaminase-like cysteine proteinase